VAGIEKIFMDKLWLLCKFVSEKGACANTPFLLSSVAINFGNDIVVGTKNLK
jgi:hypothetical protein